MKRFIYILPLFLLFGCSNESKLQEYLSENRYAIYVGETQGCQIKASSVRREYPYLTDGLVGEMTNLFEVTVCFEQKQDNPTLSFTIGDKTYGGELSYDTVSNVYTYSCTLELWEESVTFITSDYTIEAKRVNETDNTKLVLSELEKSEELTSFSGEIYLRLIYDDKCYYYVGLTSIDGTTTSLLTDETGRILARR